ncbi:MAG: PglZ domain-containing protein [Trueperaceae bacterium]|nr:PglZ domain-containing protein [Trueperaceae bacterium]
MSDRPVSSYIATTLQKKLERYGVVLFYDPALDMRSALDMLPQDVQIIDYQGSYLRVKLEAEMRFSQLRPGFSLEDTLLIYIPERPFSQPQNDPLLEYALAGTKYNHSLQAVTRQALEGRVTREQVDALFAAAEPPSLAALDSWGAREEVDSGALGVVFGTSDSVAIIRNFLSDASFDKHVSVDELQTFLRSATGLAELDTDRADEVRAALWRHLLLSELARGSSQDVRTDPPKLRKGQQDTITEVLDALRQSQHAAYGEWAERIETEESLPSRVSFDGVSRGVSRDVFAFQNSQALAQLADLVREDVGGARALIEHYKTSYWTRTNPQRQVAWQVADHAVEVLSEVKRIRLELESVGTDLGKLVGKYVAGQGATGNWYKLDTLQRGLEQGVTSLNSSSDVRPLVARARQAYSEVLYAQNAQLTKAYEQHGLTLPNVRPQQTIFRDVVEPLLTEGPTAFFLMDALRFEMGLELATLLKGLASKGLQSLEVHSEPRSGVLPSTTAFGMAALLPGAGRGLGLSEQGGPQLDRVSLAGWAERKKYWRNLYYDNMAEYRIDDNFPDAPALHKELTRGVNLLLVRMQDIDQLGENDTPFGLSGMSNLLGSIRRAVKTVIEAGFEQVVITADHGYLLFPSSSADEVEPPKGQALASHRRYWLGHVTTRPEGAIFFSPEDAGFEHVDAPGVVLAFPKGRGIFKSGGNKTYFHGGPSLQERIVPLLRVRGSAHTTPKGRKLKASSSKQSLDAHLDRIPNGALLVGRIKLQGQMGVLGADAAMPTVRIVCESEHDEVCTVLHPPSTTGEYELGPQGVLDVILQPQGALEQRWTLSVYQDTTSDAAATATWSPDQATPPSSSAAEPSAPGTSSDSLFGKSLPPGVSMPPEVLRPVIERIVASKAVPEPDLDDFMKQQGLGRSGARKLRKYVETLAQSGYPLITLDTSSMPPIYRLNDSLLATL